FRNFERIWGRSSHGVPCLLSPKCHESTINNSGLSWRRTGADSSDGSLFGSALSFCSSQFADHSLGSGDAFSSNRRFRMRNTRLSFELGTQARDWEGQSETKRVRLFDR